MSGTSGTNTVTQNSAPPAAFMSAYQNVLGQAQNVASQPLQQYQGQTVANLTPQQQQAMQEVQNTQGVAQPYIDQAQQKFNQATTPLFSMPNSGLNYIQQAGGTNVGAAGATGINAATTAANTNPSAVSNYMSPYISDVVNSTQAQFNNQNAQDRQRLAGNEVQQGAWGSDRNGIAAAELANQEQLAQAPVIAGIENTGYQTAMSQLGQQEALQANTGISAANLGQTGAYQSAQLGSNAGAQMLGANEANAWLNSQAGFGTAALGTQAQSSALSGASALLQTGGIQQQQDQANLNWPYQQYLQQQAYPFQTTGWLSGIASGTGSAAGGTGTSTSTPSTASQILGGATSLGGLTGAFGSNGWLTNGLGNIFGSAGSAGSSAGISSAFADSSVLSDVGANLGNLSSLADLSSFALFKDGGVIPGRYRGGIAGNDNDAPQPWQMTGTGGIQGYDDGGNVDDVPVQPYRSMITSDSTIPGTGISGPMLAGGISGSTQNFGYTPPAAPARGREKNSSDIRGGAANMAAIVAGASMLGSGNIGKGITEGVKYYTGQQKEAEGIDEKQAEASDLGNYRLGDLTAKGRQLSDEAQRAQDTLKQADQHFGITEARETAQQQQTAKYQQDELALGRDKLAEDRRNHNLAMGLDNSGQPADISHAIDSNSGSILAQTGLSMPGFLALTGQASKLPRDKMTRTRAFNEAEQFANKNGVDSSTFASQYEAYNDTLKQNIMRNNQTKIMEGELQGTISNLKPVADAAGNGSLRVGNVAKLFAGQEFNDPTVNQYAFNLQQLRTELAAYSAASQGRTGGSINQSDYEEAERVIKNGLSSKGAAGLQTAVEQATGKMSGVLKNSVRASNRAVWDLFGVGNNYDKLHQAEDGGGGQQFQEGQTLIQNGHRFVVKNGKPVADGPVQ